MKVYIACILKINIYILTKKLAQNKYSKKCSFLQKLFLESSGIFFPPTVKQVSECCWGERWVQLGTIYRSVYCIYIVLLSVTFFYLLLLEGNTFFQNHCVFKQITTWDHQALKGYCCCFIVITFVSFKC